MVRVHEKRHRKHGKKNFFRMEDDLREFIHNSSFTDRGACVREAEKALKAALQKFLESERRDASLVEQGKL